MFSKAALFVVSAFALAAIAAPGGSGSYHHPHHHSDSSSDSDSNNSNSNSGSGSSGNCNTGPVQCCNSVQNAQDNNPLQLLLGLVGAEIGHTNTNVGVTCSEVNAIGTGGNNCNAQTVCCENNTFNGIVALGCSPININL